MVGSAIAIDMAQKHEVTLADFNPQVLESVKRKCPQIETIQLDVTDEATLQDAISPFKLVICAVPGFLGFNTLKSIIKAKKNVIDISFFPENSLDLDELAK